MNVCPRWPLLRATFLAFVLTSFATAQSSPRPAEGDESAVVRLDPFTLTEDSGEGYTAKSSASALGFVVESSKLPITVQTLTPSFLKDLGVVKVEDALRYVSGVANEGRTSKSESLIIRGFSTDANLRNGEPFRVPTDMAIIDRVEVLKGPASIIYGVADPAGVINTVTKKPSFVAASSVSLLWDEYGSARAILDVNRPLANAGGWKVAGRLVAAHGREGFHRPNEFRDRTILAPSLRFEYGRNTKIDVDLHRTTEDGRVNRIQIPWDRGQTPFDPTVFGVGLVDVERSFTFVTPNDDWDFRSEGIDVKWVQHLSDDLTMQVSYVRTQVDREHYFNLGTGRIAPNAQGEYRAGNTLMVVEPAELDSRGLAAKLLYDLRLSGSRHQLTLGVRDDKSRSYEYAYYDNSVRADPVLQVIADANGPRPASFQGAPRSVFSLNDPNVLTLSGTTGLTNPNPVKVRTVYLTDYVTAFEDRLNLLFGVSHIDIVSQNRTATIPQAGFVYNLGRGVGLYGLYSESAKPNGPASTLNSSLGFLEPEEGEGLEVGLRFDSAGGKLNGSLAIFEISRSNIVQFLGGGIFDQNNNIPSGEETSKGVELDLTWSPTPEWSVILGYAYTDASITKQELAVTPDYNGDGVSDAVGLRKEGVAKNDIRVWTSYRFADGGSLAGLSFGGGLTWREGPIQQFPGFIQRLIQERGDPTRLDLFAAYRTQLLGRPTRLQANWYNVTDEDFLDRRGYRVQPSTLTLSLTIDL